MAQTETVLMAFNGQINLRKAYESSAEEILAVLATMRADPVKYGAAAGDIQEICRLCDAIRDLWEFGHHCQDPSLQPPQHIQRTIHPNWPGPSISKFKLRRSRFKGTDFWALADLLGLLLSSFGPAPISATKRNFFLPLTAMFAKWCQQLCTVEAKRPTVVQCTWSTAPGDERYFLGASMSGYIADKAQTGEWLRVLNRARFSVISSERFKLTNWSEAWSPSIRLWGRRKGTRFGRCAETYPFYIMLRPAANKNHIHGLALSTYRLNFRHTYDDRLSGPIWRSTWDPCQNCQELIRSMEGSVANFDKHNGRQGAPP